MTTELRPQLNFRDLFVTSQTEGKEFVSRALVEQPALFEALRCVLKHGVPLEPESIEKLLEAEARRCYRAIKCVPVEKQGGLKILLVCVIITTRWMPGISARNVVERFQCVSDVIELVQRGDELPTLFVPEFEKKLEI